MALKQTTTNGIWNVGSTWVGGVAPSSLDTTELFHAVTLPAGTTNTAGVLIQSAGSLIFPVGSSAKLSSTGNVENRGLLQMRPNSVSVVHEMQFTGIVENNFQGSGDVVLSTDVGLWTVAGGRLDLQGTSKKSWTNATGSVSAAATSMPVNDVTGWQTGDTIVIAPTSKPDVSGLDYTTVPVDPFMARFERKAITGVVGTTPSWSGGLTYAHASVTSSVTSSTYGSSSRTWTAEVGNITRNVRIYGGSATSRSHIFIKNSIDVQHNIQYVEIYWMGPRKVQSAVHASRPSLISGRYALHFHHCEFHTQNSVVYGCSIHDIGNRGLVLHGTHRVTMNNNVILDYMESAMWWDEGHITHFATWEDNLMLGMRFNGGVGPAKQISMQLLKGDGNIARRNVIVYGSNINLHGNGGYSWEANSEGVWVFEGNMAHSCGAGLWVWQNTTLNHTIVDYDSYNCDEGITHGAYTNSYSYTGGHHYRSMGFIEATSANSYGVVFKDIFWDAGGEAYGVHVIESPAAGTSITTNKIIQCVIKNYATAGVRFQGGGVGGFALPKYLDLVNNDIGNNDGSEFLWDTSPGFNDGSRLRMQKIGSGTNTQRAQVSGSLVTTNGIADFYPNVIGDGVLGLQGDYYNANAFADYKFSRFDAILSFDVWRPAVEINSAGVHHLVTAATETPPGSGTLVQSDATYSIRWTGRVQTFEAGNYNLRGTGEGKVKIYLDSGSGLTSIADQWAATGVGTVATSSAISLAANTQYDIQIDFQNNAAAGAAQGFTLQWKSPSMAAYELVPQSQLFEPTTNIPPTASAGSDQNITLPIASVSLSAIGSFDLDGTITTYAWTRISGPNTPTIQAASARDTTVGAAGTALIAGTYVFRVTVTDNDGGTDTDDVTIVVNAANSLPTVIAGTDQTITLPTSSVQLFSTDQDSDGTIVSRLWTKDSGPSSFTIVSNTSAATSVTDLVQGTYTFRMTVTDDDGGTAFDQVQVTVNPAVPNQPPTVDAGPDDAITLPTSSVILTGTANDPDGFILTQTWSFISGPNTPSIGTPAALETPITGMIAGVYIFRLTVRDNGPNGGLFASDDVTVTVTDPSAVRRLVMVTV